MKPVNYDFEELNRRTQENLITFLRVDVDLASTYCGMAESTHDTEHRAKLLEDVREVVKAIRTFGIRITDSSVRADFNRSAERLDEFLSRNSVAGRRRATER